MSSFYAQVFGKNTNATRRGFKDIEVSAQSWNGSIQTRLFYSNDDKLMVNISVAEGSSAYGNTIFCGTFDEFKKKLKQ